MYQAIEDLCEHPGEAGVIVMTAEGEKAFAQELTYQTSKTSNQPRMRLSMRR